MWLHAGFSGKTDTQGEPAASRLTCIHSDTRDSVHTPPLLLGSRCRSKRLFCLTLWSLLSLTFWQLRLPISHHTLRFLPMSSLVSPSVCPGSAGLNSSTPGPTPCSCHSVSLLPPESPNVGITYLHFHSRSFHSQLPRTSRLVLSSSHQRLRFPQCDVYS